MATQSISKLIDHLFRHESGKIVSVLTRVFGTENIDLADLNEAIQVAKNNPVFDVTTTSRIEVRPVKVMQGINE